VTSRLKNLCICGQPDGIARNISRNVRRPNVICEQASVEGGVWDTQSFQLALDSRLRSEPPLGLSFYRYSSELRRNEQLDTGFLGGGSNLPLNIDGRSRNGTDDDVYTGQSLLDGFIVGIVNLDHLGVALNGALGPLVGTANEYSGISRIGWILYLASKDDDLLDDSGSLVL
jgi:hypothetical protein